MPQTRKVDGDKKKRNKVADTKNFPPVKDISIREDCSVNDLLTQMGSSGGFQAKNLSLALDILEIMCREAPTCARFLSFPAAIISTGNRGVIKELVRRKLFDVLITTCGTLDHDIARAYKPYLSGGEFSMDDVDLEKRRIHRLGNVLVPQDSYGPLIEEKVQKVLEDMYHNGEKEPTTRLLCQRLGESLQDENSILYWTSEPNSSLCPRDYGWSRWKSVLAVLSDAQRLQA